MFPAVGLRAYLCFHLITRGHSIVILISLMIRKIGIIVSIHIHPAPVLFDT